MKKILGVLLGGVVLSAGMLGSHEALAVPAPEIEQSYLQPDGTTVGATQYGDEFFNYVAMEDGSVLEQKEDGYWYYKTEDAESRGITAKVGIDPKPAIQWNKLIWHNKILVYLKEAHSMSLC